MRAAATVIQSYYIFTVNLLRVQHILGVVYDIMLRVSRFLSLLTFLSQLHHVQCYKCITRLLTTYLVRSCFLLRGGGLN